MKIKPIKVKVSEQCDIDFDGALSNVISGLLEKLNEGWESIEPEYSYGYSEYDTKVKYYFYKHREETDAEYRIRLNQIEKNKEMQKIAEQRDLENLKNKIDALTDKQRKQLGLE